MTSLAFAIYAACVDFMLKSAALFGFTYRDANALLLFVVWPAVTLLLAAWVVVQQWMLSSQSRRVQVHDRPA